MLNLARPRDPVRPGCGRKERTFASTWNVGAKVLGAGVRERGRLLRENAAGCCARARPVAATERGRSLRENLTGCCARARPVAARERGRLLRRSVAGCCARVRPVAAPGHGRLLRRTMSDAAAGRNRLGCASAAQTVPIGGCLLRIPVAFGSVAGCQSVRPPKGQRQPFGTPAMVRN